MMALANDERIRALVRELDDAVPRDGRVVVTDDHDEGGTIVRADQVGYLRLGTEFLKAAHGSTEIESESPSDRVELDLGYLTGLDEHCYSFERREDLDPSPPRPAETEASSDLGAMIGGAIVLFLFASLLIGAFTILGWLARLLF